jgi:hypothetical protein
MWVKLNPVEIQYNINSKFEKKWISPNLIGFQNVILGIANRLNHSNNPDAKIVVDLQSQFNQTQKSLAEFYYEAKGFRYDFSGSGLPKLDFSGVPKSPILFSSSLDSIGLELVDIYLWLCKQIYEKKNLPNNLIFLFDLFTIKGNFNEVSLKAINERWEKWFEHLPETTSDQIELGKKIIEKIEEKREKPFSNYR